ncbi:helix-turn-helix transcriptional regulator [Longispora sp. NPDC051575]|uniref:helix-turn-helix domain-containing protein n=1 Tax=Longispora sp. NPDC051575 TaxID=3154943 RepID=UPI00341AE069
MPDVGHVTRILDPEERVKAATALINDYQATVLELARIRRAALDELLALGKTQTQLADLLGISRSRISAMLNAGTRPERAFLGTSRLTIAIGSEEGGTDPGSVLSAETSNAYETLSDLAKAVDLEASNEVVPPPGLVDLNRPNLIVLTSPRLLPFVGQVMGADAHLRFATDDSGWYLVDQTTGTEYRSPRDQGASTDYAYVGRLPRPDGKGNFLYLAGIHAQGTLGAAHWVADNITELYRELKARRFSTVISCRFDPKDKRKILATERVTPLYKHEGN